MPLTVTNIPVRKTWEC